MESKLPFERMERKILVRRNADTSPFLGKLPKDRTVEEMINFGVVNIDKPQGPTSHQVCEYVKNILGLDKAGHSGTLDPNVTGVLPIALGRATRIVQTLLPAGKEYIALMHIHDDFPEDKIKKVLAEFQGRIKQLPPLKSAVKRVLRSRKIYYINVHEIDGRAVLFSVGCEAGTYIRKLIHDIGLKLDSGANMEELRRTRAGPFDEKTLATLHDLKDAFHYWKNESDESYLRKIIKPIENAVAHLPKVWIFDTTIESLCHGSDLKIPGISKVESEIRKDDVVAIMSLKDELVCLGISLMTSKEMLGEKGIAVKTNKVFMREGTYLIKDNVTADSGLERIK